MESKKDKVKSWLASVSIVAGIALLFTGMLIDPQGVIDPTVLGGAGELLITGGAILGIDVVYSNKLRDIVKDLADNGKPNK